MTKQKNTLYRFSIACLLILLGVAGRILLRDFLPHMPQWEMTLYGITQPIFLADMFFIVAVFALLSGLLLGGFFSIIVPLGIMFVTDIYYGNTFIFLFTWSGFAFLGLLAYSVKNKIPSTPRSLFPVMGLGVGGVLIYDLWTNLGCWFAWYPHTLDGLMRCCVLALPFTMWHLLSTLLVLPGLWMAIILSHKYTSRLRLRISVCSPLEKYVTVTTSMLLAAASVLLLL